MVYIIDIQSTLWFGLIICLAMILIMLILVPTITVLVDPLPIMVDAHVVSEFVRHD